MIEEGVSTAGRGSGEVALRERDLKTTCFGIIAGIRACSQHENGTFQCPDVAQAGSLVRERECRRLMTFANSSTHKTREATPAQVIHCDRLSGDVANAICKTGR